MDTLQSLGIGETLGLLKLVLAGVIGKFLVDAIKKATRKVGLGMNRGTIQLFTLPAVYLVFFVIAKLTGEAIDLVNAKLITETVVAALLSVATNEAAKTDYIEDLLNIVAATLKVFKPKPKAPVQPQPTTQPGQPMTPAAPAQPKR